MTAVEPIGSVRRRLLQHAGNRSGAAPDATVAAREITRAVRETPGVHTDAQQLQLEWRARTEFLGSGSVIQPLLDDPRVSDVLINGDGTIWVDRGSGLVLARERITQPRTLAARLAAAAGQRLDDAAPVAEGRLPDGTRLHAVLAPLSAEGAAVSLRTSRRRAFTLTELTEAGATGERGRQVIEALLRVRANVLVSGATGSGKTTLVASVLSQVPPSERIICIEEATELAPTHPHVLHLQMRRANVEGAGQIGLDALVRTAMRMRPDRLVLGECRGSEVREVLAALNTGHDGGWATVHANTAQDVPARLTALGAFASLSPQTVAVQALSAIDAVIHLRRSAEARQIEQVAVLRDDGAGGMCADLALVRGADGDLHPEGAWAQLAARLDGIGRFENAGRFEDVEGFDGAGHLDGNGRSSS